MTGRLGETYYSKLKERQESPQSSLNEWSDEDTTYIAVVSEPRGNIEGLVDEVWPELGMPSWALKDFLARRAGYRTNSAIDDPHNQAYRDMNLTAVYHSHLQNSSEAERRLREATERLVSNENLTLVCYEEPGKNCHRHILMDEISERVESRESCRFKLSA